MQVYTSGGPAIVVDFADYMGERLPIFIGAVLVLSFLLLLIVFHSVVVPLKAVMMNMLSIGASFGVTVAVFQWGWGKSLVGVGKEGPVEAWAPMMLFAIVFGLSMDYEVFLLTRVREEYDKTGDNRRRRGRRPGRDRPGDLRRGGDHGLRLRQLRPGRRARPEAVRLRPGGRRSSSTPRSSAWSSSRRRWS